MREGLRSGKPVLKVDNGNVSTTRVVSEEGNSGVGDDCVVSDSRVRKGLNLVSCGPGESSGVQVKEKSCRSESIEVRDDDGRKKRKRVGESRGAQNQACVAKKVKEEESSDNRVLVFHRVLRSSSVGTGRSVKPNDQDVRGGKCVDHDGLEETTEMDREEKCDSLEGQVSKNLKRRRGRPPFVRNAESDESRPKNLKVVFGRPVKVKKDENGLKELDEGPGKGLKGKRGRPRKVSESSGVRPRKVLESSIVLRPTRGRPPEVKERNAASRIDLRRLRKVVKKEIEPLDERLNEQLRGDTDKQGEIGLEDKKGLKLQDSTETDFETRENKASSLSPEKNGATETEAIPKNGDTKPAKKIVREKIIEILLNAGWTIEHRPRFGKDYIDSVYVSLSRHTHWSVTLAYDKLKNHYEEGDGESMYYKTGFKFIPLPEDEIGLLRKVMTKERADKNKSKPRKCGNSEDEKLLASAKERVISKKKQNKKPARKSQKGKTKGKNLLHEQGKSASKGMLVSNWDHDQKKAQNGKRRTLLVRKSMEQADSDVGGYMPYAGKRTVLGWMIDLGTVSIDAKVQYMIQGNTRSLLAGRLTRDGIHCDCCNKTFTISEFETHAGSELAEPSKNICLESGTSLLQCLVESWNKQPENEREGFHHIDINGDDPNDDTCGICGDGGELICCDGCPSTFHQNCLDIQNFPSGDWHCAYCSCKICGNIDRNERQEDDNDNDNLATPELLSCLLCEEKYHQICTKENDAAHELPFCEKKCSELFKNLKKLLGIKHNLEEGFSSTLIWRSDVDSSTTACDEPQKCQVAQKIECNSKLAVALSVMDECFLPMLDDRSGINLIRNIVYNFGSNFKRLNYSGFFTAILERGDEIISAASIRIHGYQLAEMPFIGTRYMYRRQGMCRRLLSAIESVLCSLGVERLVIPAISELQETWTSVFGFRPLEISTKEKMKNMNLLVFPGVQMLEKFTLKPQVEEENMIVVEGPRSSELEEHLTEKVLCEGDKTSIKDCVSSVSAPAIDEQTVESSLHLPASSLDNTDTKCLVELGAAHDNLEAKSETTTNPLGSIGDSKEQTEEITECQNGNSDSTAPVIDLRAIGSGSQLDQPNVSEEEDKPSALPCMESRDPECGGPAICTSREDTENADCEGKLDECIVEGNVIQHEKDSLPLSTEPSSSQPQEETIPLQLDVSVKPDGCSDSASKSQMFNSDHFVAPQGLPSNDADVVQTSLTLGGIYSTSSMCSKDSTDALHTISEQIPGDDSQDCRLLFDPSYTSSRESGLKTHESLISAVDSNYDPPCGAYHESNGHCKSKEVLSGSLGVIVDSIKD